MSNVGLRGLLLIRFLYLDLKCTFTLTGEADEIDDRLIQMWEAVKEPLTIEFNNKDYQVKKEMTVDSKAYYGADGPPPVVSSDYTVSMILESQSMYYRMLLVWCRWRSGLARWHTTCKDLSSSPNYDQ